MERAPRTATFVIRLVHEPTGGVSGVVERVRTGFKQRFDSREALCRLMDEMLSPEHPGEDS